MHCTTYNNYFNIKALKSKFVKRDRGPLIFFTLLENIFFSVNIQKDGFRDLILNISYKLPMCMPGPEYSECCYFLCVSKSRTTRPRV